MAEKKDQLQLVRVLKPTPGPNTDLNVEGSEMFISGDKDFQKYLKDRKEIFDQCVAINNLLTRLAKTGEILGSTTLNELRKIISREIGESIKVRDMYRPERKS